MITVFTGLPGASKTINLIKEACENPLYKGRPVYYWNINECTVEGWKEIDLAQVHQWYDLPDGSLIILDEVQKCFRVRNKNAEVPKYITELEDHRHKGFDFLCTCQFPLQTDTWFRKLVGKHIHIERKFGLGSARHLSFERFINDPVDDYHARQNDSTKSTVKIDKKYFGTYKSSEVHTHKRRLPMKFWLVIFSAILLLLFFVFLPNFLSISKDKPKPAKPDSNITEQIAGNFNTTRQAPVEASIQTVDDYVKAHTPIIKDKPNSAPFFNELHKPVSMPRLNCLYMETQKGFSCKCYSQQATRLNVSERACVDYVKNGYGFDYTQPDKSRRFNRASGNDASGRSGNFPVPRVTVLNGSRKSTLGHSITRSDGY